jgi:hypothetical protein
MQGPSQHIIHDRTRRSRDMYGRLATNRQAHGSGRPSAGHEINFVRNGGSDSPDDMFAVENRDSKITTPSGNCNAGVSILQLGDRHLFGRRQEYCSSGTGIYSAGGKNQDFRTQQPIR